MEFLSSLAGSGTSNNPERFLAEPLVHFSCRTGEGAGSEESVQSSLQDVLKHALAGPSPGQSKIM